jgi:hypothetical protein
VPVISAGIAGVVPGFHCNLGLLSSTILFQKLVISELSLKSILHGGVFHKSVSNNAFLFFNSQINQFNVFSSFTSIASLDFKTSIISSLYFAITFGRLVPAMLIFHSIS